MTWIHLDHDRPSKSGLGGLAGGGVGPVAVEADHAPLHAPTGADHAAVLDDRVFHRAPLAVGDQGAAGAEPARDGAVSPGPERDLANLLDGLNAQVGIPEPVFLGPKAALDLIDRPAVVAGRELGIELRPPEIDGLFQPVRRRNRRAPSS